MKFVIIVHDLKTIEVYDNVEDFVNRINHLMGENPLGKRKPTHLAIDESGITIILDIE